MHLWSTTMKVSLVSYTQPVAELASQGIDNAQELIAYVARVSNPANQANTKTSKKLIDFLIQHKHWSPLELVDVTLEIVTTRDIARQMLRHRSFTFQEFSQRYANVTELENMFEFCEARMQDMKNRQGSIETDDEQLHAQWKSRQQNVIEQAYEAYEWAIQNGIAKEVARKVLPEGLTASRLYMKGSIRSWIHYLEVRGPGSGTQKEHMLVANEIASVIARVFPAIKEK